MAATCVRTVCRLTVGHLRPSLPDSVFKTPTIDFPPVIAVCKKLRNAHLIVFLVKPHKHSFLLCYFCCYILLELSLFSMLHCPMLLHHQCQLRLLFPGIDPLNLNGSVANWQSSMRRHPLQQWGGSKNVLRHSASSVSQRKANEMCTVHESGL